MNSIVKLAAATAAVALVAAPSAFAAPQGPWTGPYAGAIIQSNLTESDYISSERALGLGVYGGYNYQFARHFVLGGDVFYNWNQSKTHTNLKGQQGDFGLSVYGLDVKAGFPVGRNGAWMPYVKLGYGWDHAHGSASGGFGTRSAMRLGFGVGWRINRHVSVHAEYMYQKISDLNNLENRDLAIGASWHFAMPH